MYCPDFIGTSSVASAGMAVFTLNTGQNILSFGVLFFAMLALVTAVWSVAHRVRNSVEAKKTAAVTAPWSAAPTPITRG